MRHEEYRELDDEAVMAFAAPYLAAPPEGVEEIGDGNLNVVYRVECASGSVVVKQALPYLRVAGVSWPLTRHRAMIEAAAIEIHGKHAAGLLPYVHHASEAMSAIVLEDLRPLRTWRSLLIAGVDTPGVAATVAGYVARTHLGTSITTLTREARHRLHGEFGYSELCQVTERLVFTDPFEDVPTNRSEEPLADMAARLRSDGPLRREARLLRHAFRTRSEALIHGDLHTGSVMTGPRRLGGTDTRIIDLEFAFFGPVGFDPAMLLANLAFARVAHDELGHRLESARIDGYAEEFWEVLVHETRRLWPPAEPWWDRYRATLLGASAKYAGLELIRRTVGMAGVSDIRDLPDDARVRAQARCLAAGRSLMLDRPVGDFDELWHRATTEEAFE